MQRLSGFRYLLLLILLLFCSTPAECNALMTQEGESTIGESVEIISIRRGRDAESEAEKDDYVPAIWLRDTIIVTLTDVDSLLESGPVDLYFNGDKLPVNQPLQVGENQLEFKIDNKTAGEEHSFFKQIFSEPWVYERTVTVSVGNADGQIIQEQPAEIVLRVVHLRHFVIWIVAMAVLAAVMVYLGRRTNMLREWGDQEGESGRLNRYSLARCQMAFWFMLVVAAFSFIFLVIDKTDTIPMSMVVLMGISSATAVGAVMIDSGKKAEARSRLAETRARLETSEAVTKALENTAADSQAGEVMRIMESARVHIDRESAGSEIATLEAACTVRPADRNPLKDLMSTKDGYSLHRVQIVVWTLALGVMFVSQVMKDLSMPEFDTNLLALMGVSSTTYLGFKFPERK